jgi:hypothetical protein
MSHTPGPWVVVECDSGPCYFIEGDGGTIARTSDGVGFGGTTKANARLIAASPKMYSVLKWIKAQEHLFFAECAQAEEIIRQVKEVLNDVDG